MALGILAAIAGSTIGRAVGSQALRIAGRISTAIAGPTGRTVGRVATNPVVQGALGATAATIAFTPEGPPSPGALPVYSGTGALALPPQSGVGTLGTPIAELGNLQMVMAPQYEQRVKCPTGYVSVRIPQGNGTYVQACMYKPLARTLKLWRPRRKPPISASDWRTYQKAGRVERKLAGIAKKEGFTKPARRRKGPNRG